MWVGWHDPESHRIDPVAQAGDSQDYLDKIRVYADDRPEGRGPVGVCIREGRPCIFNDFVDDPRAEPWHEAATAHGLHSVTALPIRVDGKVVAALVVYAGEAGLFRDKEVALLEETAASMSFALDYLEQERKRRQSEDSLRVREAQYRAVIETTSDGFWMLDAEGRLLEVNDAYVRRSGYSRAELLGMHISDLEAQESPEETAAHIARIIRDGNDLFQSLHRRKNGTVWPVEVTTSYWPDAGGHFFGFVRDITERKRAEEALVEGLAPGGVGGGHRHRTDSEGDQSREVLRSCCEAIVGKHLDAAFARIWTLDEHEQMLVLQASAGMYTHLDGSHSRVPVGSLKIGLIAQEHPALRNGEFVAP